MAEFDINKELEEIKFEDYLQTDSNIEVEAEYFFHGHRLGTRVPLFLIISDSWKREAIRYLCKIGNVLSLIEKIRSGDIITFPVILKLLRRYGSNCGIMIHFDGKESSTNHWVECLRSSSFLRSEICCFAQISKQQLELKTKPIEVLDGVKMIQIRRVNDFDLQNALILESIQKVLQLPCLDWTWQYEQSDKLFLFSKLVFKNLEKWKNTESRGDRVEGTKMIPMKLMRDDDEDHSPQHVLDLYPKVGLIIDLSNDEGSYEKEKFLENAIEYKRIQIESKVIPSSRDVFHFISIVKDFSTKNPSNDIIVHCHYGYNRTGLMICAYLIEECNVNVKEALTRFKAARPPGIKHQNYIDKLILRYSDVESM